MTGTGGWRGENLERMIGECVGAGREMLFASC